MAPEPTPDEIPFPALPEKADTPAQAPDAAMPSPPLPGESTDDALEREVFEFVTQRLNAGTEENELVREVREFGLREKAARTYVRQVSAQHLEENYEPDVLHLIADLVDAGKSPQEIVAALQEQDLTAEEAWRLLRDVEAMKLEIADGRALIKRAGIIVGALAVVTLILCVTLLMVPSLLLMLGLLIWAGRSYSEGKKRVAAAESLLYPPRSGAA